MPWQINRRKELLNACGAHILSSTAIVHLANFLEVNSVASNSVRLPYHLESSPKCYPTGNKFVF